MNKTIITKKINNYLDIEYEKEDLKIIKIWYTSKQTSYSILYDTKEKRFFAFPGYTNPLTKKQCTLIENTINKIKNI